MKDDRLISLNAAIKAIEEDEIDLTDPNIVAIFKATGGYGKAETQVMTCDRHVKILKDLPSAQPEITLESAIDYLHSIGWMQNHDRILTESAQPKAIRPKFVAEDRYVTNYFQTFPHCPKCNYEVETGDCYCRVCGQHIDWSEDDE